MIIYRFLRRLFIDDPSGNGDLQILKSINYKHGKRKSIFQIGRERGLRISFC